MPKDRSAADGVMPPWRGLGAGGLFRIYFGPALLAALLPVAISISSINFFSHVFVFHIQKFYPTN